MSLSSFDRNTLSFAMVVIIVAAIALIPVLLYHLIGKARRRHFANYIRPYYSQIDSINDRLQAQFGSIVNDWRVRLEHTPLKSKQQYDQYDSWRAFLGYVEENSGSLSFITAEGLEAYGGEIQQVLDQVEIPDTPWYLFQDGSYLYWTAIKTLQRHSFFTIIWGWSYTSPKGRNHYSDQITLTAADLAEALSEVAAARANRQTASYQRSLMTSSLRFQILKRDNYTCQICGRTQQDGVKLEVDHKIPVAKGGKTEESNLWTLCMECNRGKGTDSL